MSTPPPKPFTRAAEKLIASFRNAPPDENAPRQRKRTTKEISQLIPDLLAKHHIGTETPVNHLREHWPEIVGNTNAQYSHPLEIDIRNRLIILTRHPLIRDELYHQKKLILERIRIRPGCDKIKHLHFRAA